MLPRFIEDTPEGVLLTIHVQPNARLTECHGMHGDALKVRVAASPVDGAANDELCRFLAQCFGLARGGAIIRRGAKGRRKQVRLQGVSPQQVCDMFGPDVIVKGRPR